jgi:hypothetical protein
MSAKTQGCIDNNWVTGICDQWGQEINATIAHYRYVFGCACHLSPISEIDCFKLFTSLLLAFLATLISGHCRPTDLCVATAPGKGRRYVRRVGSGHK